MLSTVIGGSEAPIETPKAVHPKTHKPKNNQPIFFRIESSFLSRHDSPQPSPAKPNEDAGRNHGQWYSLNPATSQLSPPRRLKEV